MFFPASVLLQSSVTGAPLSSTLARMSDSAKPPFSIGRLPSNVEAAIVSPEGNITYILKPYPVSDKWPDVWVDSSAFKKLPMPEKLYSQAKAFLEAAILCCESAGKAPEKAAMVTRSRLLLQYQFGNRALPKGIYQSDHE